MILFDRLYLSQVHLNFQGQLSLYDPQSFSETPTGI